MKRGIYIHAGSNMGFPGVDKKIHAQIKILSAYYDMSEIIIRKKELSFLQAIISRLPGGSYGRDYYESFEEIRSVGEVFFFYIRDQAWDRDFKEFIRRLREVYPQSKILLEIPTYPYAHELLSNSTMWPWYFKDKWNRRRMEHLMDRVVTFSADDLLFGVPTIKTMNGVIVDDYIPVCNKKEYNNESTIDMIAVAQFQPSHGYERILRALNNYYSFGNKRQIRIHFVGEGSELNKYRKMVADNNLEEYTVFHGFKTGNELSEIYGIADVALGCFGIYKRGAEYLSPIKTREYMAYGIPFVGSGEDIFKRIPKRDFFM